MLTSSHFIEDSRFVPVLLQGHQNLLRQGLQITLSAVCNF